MSESLPPGIPDLSHWHREVFRIRHKDIDYREELRLSSVLTMLQEAAWNHARVLGVDYGSPGFTDKHWVLSRLQVACTGTMPEWMGDAVVSTYPSGVEKLFALREFVVAGPDGQVCALAGSAWILINASTRQPCRPGPLMEGLHLVPTPRVLPDIPGRLVLPEGGRECARAVPGYRDLDAHSHVNNVAYAEWCLDTLDAGFFDTRQLAGFEVNFLSELRWGEAVTVIRHDHEEGQTFGLRKDDGTMAALLRFRWRPRRV